jgi:membrane-associated phospholipid phosphatase
MMRGAWALVAAGLAVLASQREVHADVPTPGTLPVESQPVPVPLPHRHEGRKLEWDPSFDRMDAPEIVVTGASAGIALAGAIATPLKTGWTGGILFDDAARNALRLSSYQARLDVRDASDVGLALISTFPVLVDSALVAYWYRGSDDVALQMTLIDAEAVSISAGLQGAVNFFSGRARPYVRDCGGAVPSNSIDCNTTSENRSFFSGHSAISFTSAGLICAHHLRLHLFDSGADAVTCVTALVAAAGIATMRVMGDMHYASDVLTGAILGTSVGLGVPLLHHYTGHEVDQSARSDVTLHIVPIAFGAALGGTF